MPGSVVMQSSDPLELRFPSVSLRQAGARMLYVAQAWPVGSDPAVYFTSIAAAYVAAAALLPTKTNPVMIVVGPGTYSGPIVLTSNVHLFGYTPRSVFIDGAMSWTPGAGVNAGQAALNEYCSFVHIRFNPATGTIAVNSTAKTGNTSVIDMRDCEPDATLTFTSRPGQVDFFQCWDCTIFGDSNFSNTNVNLFGGSYSGALNFTGNCAIDICTTEIFGNVSILGTSTGRIAGCMVNNPISVGAGCSLSLTGSMLSPGAVLTVAAGGSADIRAGEYSVDANLAGAGAIDRSIIGTSSGLTALGANAIAISPPLPVADYVVVVTETSAAGGAVPSVSGKATNGFTLNDSIGGRTFDLAILRK